MSRDSMNMERANPVSAAQDTSEGGRTRDNAPL